MRFEGDDSPDRRFTGTITSVGDFSPQWKDSKWMSLKVQWDEPASVHRPDRVSPWEIEPFTPSISVNPTPSSTIKSKRPNDISISESVTGSPASPGFWYGSVLNPELTRNQPEKIWSPSPHNGSLKLFDDSMEESSVLSVQSLSPAMSSKLT